MLVTSYSSNGMNVGKFRYEIRFELISLLEKKIILTNFFATDKLSAKVFYFTEKPVLILMVTL